MKTMKQFIRIYTLFILLCFGGIINEAWAYKVTYHILTLPIDNDIYHLADDFDDKRLEAFRVVDNSATTVGLPDAYKSPLAENFRYYDNAEGKVTKSATAVAMYEYSGNNKSYHYTIADGATDIAGNTVTGDMEVYVIYDYKTSNTIADLTGGKEYNLTMSGGFLGFNRGRNNRIAVIPESANRVDENALVSEDFVNVDVSNISGTNITNYWNGNPNPRANVAGQFYFIFKFEGSDPYNILIRTAYDKDYTYIEKHGSETQLYYKYYKNSHLFWPTSDNSGFFLASDDHTQYTQVSTGYDPDEKHSITSTSRTGYFKSKGSDLTYNSFALLNNTSSNGYVFMISRYIDKNGDISTPGHYSSASYRFLTRDGSYNNLKSESKTLAQASASYSTDQKIYQVNNYVFKVKRKCSAEDFDDLEDEVAYVRLSEYFTSGKRPEEMVPDELKRKYVTFTGAYKQYVDEELDTKFNTFADVNANALTEVHDGKTYKIIWLDYTTNMPFETWTDADSDGAVDYDELTWYNLNMEKSTRNSAYWDGTKIKTSRDLSKYARAAHYAFVGDPYDLKIVGRKVSEDGSGNASTLNYMKLNATLASNTAFDASGTTWSIMYDDNTGDYQDCFRLKDNSGDKYLHQNSSNSDYPLNGIDDPEEAVRITAAALPLKNYIYYIMRSDGSIAVMSQGRHEPSAKLGYNTIPESIRSPFINGLPLTFYGSYTASEGGAASAKSDASSQTNAITYAKDTENGDTQNIVVRYTFASGNPYYSYLNDATYNVRLNGQFIYYDNGDIKSKASITDSERTTATYQWVLGGQDPYAMTVKQSSTNKFVTIDSWPADDDAGTGAAIKWSDSALKFIVKSSGDDAHAFEVMGATGESYDAMDQSFNIGRPSDNTVKVYSDWSYLSGSDVLRFELIPIDAVSVTYHLVDIKNNTELLSVQTRQASSSAPVFPADYRSPLVSTYTYWSSLSDAQSKTGSHPTDVSSGEIYVTYTANSLVDMTGHTMYLMKYAQGENFRQEDGADGLTEDPVKAVYPYCNGDGNFFVYSQEEYDKQQQLAASTRTRWAWYVESATNDPYHIKIYSRQIETYNSYDTRAYFRTYTETFGDETKHVVTNLSWPGISGEQGTEYMVLGSAGQFRLLTSDKVDVNGDGDNTDAEDVRCAVNSFEQYWKTWNTIRKVVLGDTNAAASQSDPNIVPATPATAVATAAGKNNRTYLTDEMGWHCYEQWAYAVRWNGYNKAGAKNKKGWEDLEHWFQTVTMGEGYFDFVPTTIDPVLVLLDQHGWEIMRKPLPTDPDDPDKATKYDAIRPYDSPMVKEYHFWGGAKKRTGFHQYYELSDRITVDGEPYVSTSLTKLPDYYNSDGTRNTTIIDSKGNQLDEYVTYVVKDEYVQANGKPFLIQQGSHFAYNNSDAAAIGTNDVPTTGGMSQYIIDNVGELTESGTKNKELWCLKPNPDIDIEMGYQDAVKFPGGYAHDWTNDYTKTDFSASGFDPYNIQISSVPSATKYFVTDATTAAIDEGSIVGNGTTNTLGAQASVTAALSGGMDNRTLQMTNATFMAVQDAAGNMQLMPRFDHSRRLKDFSTLVYPDDTEKEKTYTKLYRPLVYTYKIIDNGGNESLRYQGGGDLVPQTPNWFKSPLATDFQYYKNLTLSEGVYTEIKNKTDISAKEITESLEGAEPTDNIVYVRYSYDEDADVDKVLQGRWLTMQLNNYDMFYGNGTDGYGIYDDTTSSKPATINASAKEWQWKFLESPFSDPDPYAVPLYNRDKTDGPAITEMGAILSHTSGNYALIKARTGDMTYKFLKSKDDTSKANTWDNESNFKSTSCTFDGTRSQMKLINEVTRTFNYRIYTNDGNFAVSADQDDIIEDNTPTLPEEIKSPLLNTDQFLYYETEEDMGNSAKELKYLYGLYDDIVYVRYTNYDLNTTEYKVPNVKATVGGKVARGDDSNDAALDINGQLIYNIIWYDDNIMQSSDGTSISDGGSLTGEGLSGSAAYVWQFEGNDPYAIKIKHKDSGDYAVGSSTLADTPTSTFMLLPSSDDWEYGMLQVTGDDDILSGYGQTTVTSNPTKFIIFGLSTHKVIYHLVIANIGNNVRIPYSTDNDPMDERYDSGTGELVIAGTSCRDLTTTTTVTGDTYQLGETINGVNYCVDDGHITLGDPLKVPDELKRPNCKYFFYVEGVYTHEDCSRSIPYGTSGSHISELDDDYRGLQITKMGIEPELLGTTVVINIEYQFDDGLTETNTGTHFVTNSTGTEWYTFETSDATPYMANFTYKDNILRGKEGRIGHYTNEFLWSPVGDPYGFKMYNRYVYKNGTEDGHANKVMTTSSAPAADADLIMAVDATNKPIYELLAGTTDGNFKVQTLTIPGSGTPYYIDNSSGTIKLKTETTTEWHFGLDQSLFDPYYLGVGNVGGLNETGKTAYEAAANLMEKQAVVYNDDNIVAFTPGYYRIFNQPNSQGIKIPTYLSGYTHKTELTSAIPMHFYEKEGVTTNFEQLVTGFTSTVATQGQIPIAAPEYDPASIFYITSGSGSAPYTMQTQGLYVKENKMTDNSGQATNFQVIDIGGAVVLLHDGAVPASRKYLHYKQTGNIYDVKFQDGVTLADDDAAKWCMEPANKKGLWIETHSGGEEEVLTNLWYYSSYCVPFDMLIQRKNEDDGDGEGVHSSNAYTCVEEDSPWDEDGLHPKAIGKYNTGTYAANDYFVPAGTPVLFSTRRATEYIKATIPTTSPSSSISTIFSYEYLEQQLPSYDDDRRVYVFGPKMEGTFTLNSSTGAITAVFPSLGNTNVGFHVNANLNKESGMTTASWTRHNYYVLHNRIYYRAPEPTPAKSGTVTDIQFVPVFFDDEEIVPDEDGGSRSGRVYGDNRIYDMSGRCVASETEVLDGSWRQHLAAGIYILNGKKFVKK